MILGFDGVVCEGFAFMSGGWIAFGATPSQRPHFFVNRMFLTEAGTGEAGWEPGIGAKFPLQRKPMDEVLGEVGAQRAQEEPVASTRRAQTSRQVRGEALPSGH